MTKTPAKPDLPAVPSAAEDLLFQTFNEIGIISQLATARLERVLPMGLRASQFSILNHMVRLGDGRTHQALTNAFQVTKGAMTNNLTRLLDKGLLTMQVDALDGRVKRYYLTSDGRRVREEARVAIGLGYDELLAAFEQQEFADALPFLRRLRSYLDEHREV
jgi:DNA-binding MarR family transcriptional regulator